jgi:hypothetical protein
MKPTVVPWCPPNLKGEEEGEEDEEVVEASVIVDDVQGPDSPKAYTSVSAAGARALCSLL